MSNNSSGGAIQIPRYSVGEKFADDLVEQYSLDYDRHLKMLSNLVAATVDRRPMFYIRSLPSIVPSAGTSASNLAAQARYSALDRELDTLSTSDDPGMQDVEAGAIDTAKALVRHLASREIAPPELARLSHEAIVMLWALGDTKYAITVTDGELAYVVRRAKDTLKRKANIKPHQFEILRLK